MYSLLVTVYLRHWRKFLINNSLGLDWLFQYPTTPPPPTQNVPNDTDCPIDGSDDEDGLIDGNDDEDGPEPETLVDPQFEERFSGVLGS